MLQKIAVPINITGGIETKQDKKLVVRGKLTLLENGILKKSGNDENGSPQFSIEKRNGYRGLGNRILGGNVLSSADAMNVFNDELLLFSQQSLYSYAPSVDAIASKGNVVPVTSHFKNVARSARQQTQYDSVTARVGTLGITVTVWKDGTNVRASVVDESSGAPFQAEVIVGTGTNPRCVVLGGAIFVVYVNGTDYCQRRLDPLNPTEFETEVVLTSDIHATTKHHDITEMNANSAIFAYRVTGGTLKLGYLTSAGAVGSSLTGYPDPITVSSTSPDNCIGIFVHPTTFQIFVGFHSSSAGLKLYSTQQSLAGTTWTGTIDAATTPAVRNFTAVQEGTGIRAFWEKAHATNTYMHQVYEQAFPAVGPPFSGSATVLMKTVGLASKAFLSPDGSACVNVVHDSTLQATLFTVASGGGLLAKSLYTLSGGLTDGSHLPRVDANGSQYAFPVGVKTRIVSENAAIFTVVGVGAISLDFGSNQRYFGAALGENFHIIGGYLSSYDGKGVVEHGFHLFPENVSLAQAATGGSLADGTYQVCALWEWTDAKGQIHRSSPSVPVSIVMSGGGSSQKITATVPCLALTGKQAANSRSEVSIVLFRTEKNGTVFYRGTSITSPTYNDPTADSVAIVLSGSDATLISNEILYTTGGILGNDAPPSCSLIAASKSRLFLAGLPDGNEVAYSKEFSLGEGVAFSEFLRMRFDPAGGPVRGLAVMDDKVIGFKYSAIHYFSGTGPNDTGEQGAFTEPEVIPGDVGCVNANSIVSVPAGIMFKSAKGIFLLNRALQLQYIGKAVEAYNGLTITSADVVTDDNQVRFLTLDGPCLVYDYYSNEWSTFTNHEGKDAALWKNQYVYLRADAPKLYIEVPGYYQDDTVGIKIRGGTAWIKMAGIQGYQRVYEIMFLGEYISKHLLRVKVGFDYQDDILEDHIFNAGSVLEQSTYGDDAVYGEIDVPYGGDGQSLYQASIRPGRQKCQAFRLIFEDITPDVFGASFSLSGLTAMIGIKKGLNKLGSSRRE